MPKWLFILPNNPGDVVMALQAMQSIKQTQPALILHFLVDTECADLCHGLSFLEKVWILPRKEIQKIAQNKGEKEAKVSWNLFLEELLKTSFDKSVNWFQGEYGGWLQNLIDAREKVGPQRNLYGDLILNDQASQILHAIPAQRESNHQHVIEHYAQIAGIQTQALSLTPLWCFTAKPEYIAFQMGTAWSGKQWPLEKWISLGELFLKQGQKVLLIGAPSETPLGEQFCQLLAHYSSLIRNFIGKTKLSDLPELFSTAKFLVTGDSLAMHVAAASHLPVYALFGASSFYETGPYAPGSVCISPKGNQPDFNFKNGIQIQGIDAQALFQLINNKSSASLDYFEAQWNPALQKMEWVHPFGLKKTACRDQRPLPAFLPKQIENLRLLLENPSLERLSSLEENEKAFRLESDQSAFWEIYRFELNSLDPYPWRKYFQLRLKLLEKKQRQCLELQKGPSDFPT